MKALFDTCILIDYLNGVMGAKQEFDLYGDKAISVITWMEIMVGVSSAQEVKTKVWLANVFTLIGINDEISHCAVEIRKEMRVKLPDAIIFSTAKSTGRLFVTRNTKDFKQNNPAVRVPYEIKPRS